MHAVTNVTLQVFRQAIWKHIWKSTQEKNRSNVTNVTMHVLNQVLWGYIRKLTPEKNLINAANVTLQQFTSQVWLTILRVTWEKKRNHSNATTAIMHLINHPIWRHIWELNQKKILQMQPMWPCLCSKKQFEETFENSSWGKEELMNFDLYKSLNWELKEIRLEG